MLDTLHIKLIDGQKVSLKDVTDSLLVQKEGTTWAAKTNQYAINYAIHLGEVYGDNWYKGFLAEEFFSQILLPKHGHSDKELDDRVFFPTDTPVFRALEILQEMKDGRGSECLELIKYLKGEIKKDGFTHSIVLAKINGVLKHVDGLHRMLAMAMLLKEGNAYKEIPVFLCDNTR